ncbi:MAG: FAD-dependent oxidoreductase [Deltaproteobacteria bacterium]|nr:FAD-dependent oxidoreductase [Deltaproteobacteria bacterium]
MQRLFSSFQIKGLHFKNRIVMPPLASFLLDRDGTVTDKAVEHYRMRAAGGPAMIIMEACAVSREGIVSFHQARIDEDRFVEGLSKIARVIKAEGAIPAVQIHHGGRQTSVKVIGRNPLAPSPLPCPAIRGEVEALTVSGIRELVQKFGDAAVRVREAGFELLELHGAHGYLINQFLSPFSNIRQDAYGGDLEGRTRFAREVLQEVRRRLGPDFPVSFKISAQEFVPNGLTLEESIAALRILIPEGIDMVQVSAGNDATPEWICQPMFMKKACLADSARAVKKAVNIPVMSVGRINDPFIAERIIAEEKADLVCIGRGLLADPEMPKKAKEGRFDDIRTCIACNTCMESIFKKGRVECLVNPTLGREREMAVIPAKRIRKIMVVGGGPGGMDASLVAAQRGHRVDLYEKGPVLGGQLIPGSATSYKKEMLSLIRFQSKQMRRYGVRVHLNREIQLKDVLSEKPDVVIVATGSLPAVPPLEGIEHEIVCSFSSVLDGKRPPPRETVVIGGGPTGCEVAFHLSEQGCPVTVVEMLPKAGKGLEAITEKVLFEKLAANGVRFLTGCRPLRISTQGVWIKDAEDGERFLPAGRVVLATGIRPNTVLYDRIKDMGFEVYRIGDCLEPRTAKDAILEGARLGRAL